MVRDIPKELEQPGELTVLQKVQISAALCLSLGERVDWTIQIAPWHKMGGNGVSGVLHLPSAHPGLPGQELQAEKERCGAEARGISKDCWRADSVPEFIQSCSSCTHY